MLELFTWHWCTGDRWSMLLVGPMSGIKQYLNSGSWTWAPGSYLWNKAHNCFPPYLENWKLFFVPHSESNVLLSWFCSTHCQPWMLYLASVLLLLYLKAAFLAEPEPMITTGLLTMDTEWGPSKVLRRPWAPPVLHKPSILEGYFWAPEPGFSLKPSLVYTKPLPNS